jgi:hypothetical protein
VPVIEHSKCPMAGAVMNGVSIGDLHKLPAPNTTMRSIFFTLALLLGATTFAQAPMERVFTMPGALDLYGVAVDPEGHYLMANEAPTSDENSDDLQITRIAPDGTHEWTKVYSNPSDEGLYANCIAGGPDGILVVGFTMGDSTYARDGVVLRLDYDGNLLDAQRVDVNGGSNAFHTLTAVSDGFIAGGRTDANGQMYDMQLTKFNTLGQIQWSRSYGSTGWDWGYQAIELADGGYALVGYGDQLGTGFSPSGYLVRTDSQGNELWARSISSGNSVDEMYCIAESPTGELYVGGRSLGYFLGNVNAFVTKLTATGDQIWTRVLEEGIEVWALAPQADGGVAWLAHPQYIEGGAGDYDMAWGSFSAAGALQSSRLHGDTGSDNAMAMVPLPNGGLAVMGFTNSWNGTWQGDLILTDSIGNGACNVIPINLVWNDATATVAPFTSNTASGYTSYAWAMGQADVAVTSENPCCAAAAAFTMEAVGDGYTWTFTNTSTDATTWSWDFGDGATSTAFAPVHTYTANGTYTVCLTAGGSCGEATTCESMSITVGIHGALDRNNGVTVHPLPADAVLQVEGAMAITDFRLLDHGGRVVRQLPANGPRLLVPVKDLPAGAYLARTTLADGRVVNLRVLLAH